MSTKSIRGGKRRGAGRKASDRIPKHIKLDRTTLDKIEDMLDYSIGPTTSDLIIAAISEKYARFMKFLTH